MTVEILKHGRRVLTVRNTHPQHRAETLRRLATDLPCVCMHVRVSHCSFCPHQDPVAQLPADLVTRAYSIFAIILKYAVDMLTWEQADKLPAGLEPPYEQTHTAAFTAIGSSFSLWLLFVFRDRGDTYYCMLFNDEVHTYEQVIYTLQKAVNCSQKEAVSFATTVDRDVSTTFICIPATVSSYIQWGPKLLEHLTELLEGFKTKFLRRPHYYFQCASRFLLSEVLL